MAMGQRLRADRPRPQRPRADLPRHPLEQGSRFDPRTGKWLDAPGELAADDRGAIRLPPFPGPEERSTTDWALKVRLKP